MRARPCFHWSACRTRLARTTLAVLLLAPLVSAGEGGPATDRTSPSAPGSRTTLLTAPPQTVTLTFAGASRAKGGTASTFTASAEGWTVHGNGMAVQPEWKKGYIHVDNQGPDTWYWRAPLSFHGNRRDFYGSALRFAMCLNQENDRPFGPDLPFVIIKGKDLSISFTLPGGMKGFPGPGLHWHALILSDARPWISSATGKKATREEILKVLGDVRDLLIRGEFQQGENSADLVHVSFGPPKYWGSRKPAPRGGATGRGTLAIEVTPLLQCLESSGAPVHRAVLKVGKHELDLSEDLDRETAIALKEEATKFLRALSIWFRDLTEHEVALLRAREKLAIHVTKPYLLLERFKGETFTFPLAWKGVSNAPRLYFMVRGQTDMTEALRLPPGEPFWVEARYPRASQDLEKRIRMHWDGGHCDIALQQMQDLASGYRAGPFMVEPGVAAERESADRPASTMVTSIRSLPVNAKEKGPRKLTHHYRQEYGPAHAWLYGSWKVAYQDAKLGAVEGEAQVTGDLDGILVQLRQRGSDRLYHLRSASYALLPDDREPETLKMVLFGRSPPSGEDASAVSKTDADRAKATKIAAALGTYVTIRTHGSPLREGGAAKTAEVAFAYPLTVELDVPPGDVRETLSGSWRYSAPKSKEPHDRAGEWDAAGLSCKGKEAWTRLPMSLDGAIRTQWLSPYQQTPAGESRVAEVIVRFRGTNLPVQPNRSIRIEFDDPHLTFNGTYSTDPSDTRFLDAHVWIESDMTGGHLKKVRLNDVETTCDLGKPESPIDVCFTRRFWENEYERANGLYFGEVFTLEATYAREPLLPQAEYLILTDGLEPVKIVLKKTAARPDVMRSAPLLLWGRSTPPSEEDLASQDAEEKTARIEHVVRARSGKELLAVALEDATAWHVKKAVLGTDERPRIAQVVAGAYGSDLWQRAMERARACHDRNPKLYEFTDRNMTDIVARLSRMSVLKRVRGRTVRGSANVFRKRTFRLEIEDHAAMLLVKDQLRSMLHTYYLSLTKRPTSARDPALWSQAQNEWLAYMIDRSNTGKPHPMFHLKVKRPEQAPGLRTEWYLSEALGDAREMFDSKAAFEAYAKQALAEANFQLYAAARKSEERVSRVRDQDIEALVRLMSFAVEPVVESIAPRLVRRRRQEEPRVPNLVPDGIARSRVRRIAAVAETIRAQKAYSDLDTQMTIMALTAVFAGSSYAGLAVNSSRAGFMAYTSQVGLSAADLYDLYDMTKSGWDVWKERQNVLLAKGLLEVVGPEKLEAAREAYKEKLINLGTSIAMNVAPKVGKGVASRWEHRTGRAPKTRRPRPTDRPPGPRSESPPPSGQPIRPDGVEPSPTNRTAPPPRHETQPPPSDKTAPPPQHGVESAPANRTAPPPEHGTRPPPADAAAPPPASTKITGPGAEWTTMEQGHQPMDVRTTLVADRLRRLGVSPENAQIKATIMVHSWGLNTDQAAVAAAFDHNVSAVRLMEECRLPPRDIARHLEHYARLRGVVDPNMRAFVVLRYLGAYTPDAAYKRAFDVPPAVFARELSPLPRDPTPRRVPAGSADSAWTPMRNGRRWDSPFGELHMDETRLGQGGFGDVHRLLDQEGKPSGYVAKYFETGTGKYGKRNFARDQRARVESIEYGAHVLESHGIPQPEILHVNPDAPNGGYIVQRELGHHMPKGAIEEIPVKALLKERGLEAPECEAITKLWSDLNQNRIACEDPNAGNVFLRKYEDGRVEAGILDQDRIVQCQESTDLSVSGASHADEFAGLHASHDREFIHLKKTIEAERLETRKKAGMNPFEAANKADIQTAREFNCWNLLRQGWVQYTPERGFHSGYLDLKTVHERFPDLPETLGLPPGREWSAAAHSSHGHPSPEPVRLENE